MRTSVFLLTQATTFLEIWSKVLYPTMRTWTARRGKRQGRESQRSTDVEAASGGGQRERRERTYLLVYVFAKVVQCVDCLLLKRCELE